MPRGMTDYEMLRMLEATDCPQQQKSQVERVLTDVQAVKFGPVEPSKMQVLKDIESVIEFISAAGERVEIKE